MSAYTVIMIISSVLSIVFTVIGAQDVLGSLSLTGILAVMIFAFFCFAVCFVLMVVWYWVYSRIYRLIVKPDLKIKSTQINKETVKPSTAHVHSRPIKKASVKSNESISYQLLYHSTLSDDKVERFISLHLDTTGWDCDKDRICQISAVYFENGEMVDEFCVLVHPEMNSLYDEDNMNDMPMETLDEESAMIQLIQFLRDALDGNLILVSYNAKFTMEFLQRTLKRNGYSGSLQCADIHSMSRDIVPDLSDYKMDAVAEKYSIDADQQEKGLADAVVCAKLFLKLIEIRKPDYSWTSFYRGYQHKEFYGVVSQYRQLWNWGPNNQMIEILNYFASNDRDIAREMLETLVEEKHSFTPEQILELNGYSEELVGELAKYAKPFHVDQLVELESMLGIEIFEQIKNRLKVKK